MQAIQTKYMPATNYRGSRIKAECDGGKLTVGWNYGLDPDQNHRAAMLALVKKLGWNWDGSSWVSGGLKDGTRVHVCVTRSEAMDMAKVARKASRVAAGLVVSPIA